jgi:glycosyltransferase involved in cell wall biosynthesis
MWQGQRVSVVFPAYNEEAGIAAAVTDFRGIEAVDEIVVVDNNSRDTTALRAVTVGARVLKLLAFADDFDLVLGTRTTRELIWHGANMGWQLRWGNWIVAKLLQVLFDGPSLSDCGCTLRLARRSAVERLLPRFTVGGSHFLPEMVCLALLERLRLVEVPVNYRDRVGESKITGSLATALRVGVRMIALIFRYRLLGR